ncbi:hypothetical protein [Konateibacter massiliensis]|uniref:hypothetical protein n=1 Tax=Konateibacter massiliensis TaxID=2002841 RepID=UPI000C153008|nr:hypothetical protein [Konateibacter massiliensis]
MMKAYLVSTFTDSGKVNAWVYAEGELPEEYHAVLADGGYASRENYDLYVDEFNSMDEAIEKRAEALKA